MQWTTLLRSTLLAMISFMSASAAPLTPSLELQGHRGARGLAPENTLPAFNLAYLYGVTTLELDSTLTSDGLLVIYHDTETNPRLCLSPEGEELSSRPVLSLSSQELRALECGLKPHPRFPDQVRQSAHPPRLSDVVQLEDLWGVAPFYNLEIKTSARHSPLHKLSAIEALSHELRTLTRTYPTLPDRLTLQSFDLEILKLAKTHLPKLRRSVLFEPQIDRSVTPPRLIMSDHQRLIEVTEQLEAEVISPYHEAVTQDLLREAHTRGLKVIPWTVNDPSRMKALIELGVDGLISDYPDRLTQVVAGMGGAVECRTRHADAACELRLSSQDQRALRTPLVTLRSIDPSVKRELRYAGVDNFLGRPARGYDAPQCLLTRPAAEALSRAQAELKASHLSLKVFDCYRPQRAVNDFIAWARDLKDQKMKAQYYPSVAKAELFRLGYIAERSGHSRGSTVDLTIEGLDMGTPWDFFGVESHTRHPHHPQSVRANRALLVSVMRRHGFINYEREWWHFTLSPEPLPHLYLDLPIK